MIKRLLILFFLLSIVPSSYAETFELTNSYSNMNITNSSSKGWKATTDYSTVLGPTVNDMLANVTADIGYALYHHTDDVNAHSLLINITGLLPNENYSVVFKVRTQAGTQNYTYSYQNNIVENYTSFAAGGIGTTNITLPYISTRANGTAYIYIGRAGAAMGAGYIAWKTLYLESQSQAGTGISGIVYEVIDGVNATVSNALVTLSDNLSTMSMTAITGEDGRYSFSGLTNQTTYFVKASRSDIYKDSTTLYITTGTGTWTTRDILLQRCTSDYDCGNNQHYVSFYVQTIYYQPYPNVSVTVYNDGDTIASYNDTTGTDGVYQVRLIKNQKYTVTFNQGSNTATWSNYFPSDAYTVTLGTLPLDFQYNISGNSTILKVQWSNLNGAVNMSILNTTSRIHRQGNDSTSAGGQFTFTVKNKTDIYYLYFNASTSSGNVNMSRIYDFRPATAHPIGRNWTYGSFTVSQTYKNYISYVFIICLAGTFGALYAPLGGVILILTTLFFVWYGWLAVAGISSSFVGGIAVIVVIRYLQTKDGE